MLSHVYTIDSHVNVRRWILRYCMLALANNGIDFVPFDMLQERNVRDIKVQLFIHQQSHS